MMEKLVFKNLFLNYINHLLQEKMLLINIIKLWILQAKYILFIIIRFSFQIVDKLGATHIH